MSSLAATAAGLAARRPVLARIVRNFGWQSFDKLFRMGVGVFVSVLITRYLGRLPHKGESLTVKGLVLEVLDVDQKKVKKLLVHRA